MLNLPEGTVLLIDKPYEWTSFDAVNKIRYACGGRKIKVGHAGTLDPLATGLLIICVGKKTKTIDSIQSQEKEYTGTFTIGATTPSYDLETEVDNTYPTEHITTDNILATARTFIGFQEQIPPVFSAIKINGKRAYDKARKGEKIEMKKRPITIEEFEITNIALPEISFRIKCSKGTYIRSIAHDFGSRLQSGAYLSSLKRTKIGEFSIEDASPLIELADQIKEDRLAGENL